MNNVQEKPRQAVFSFVSDVVPRGDGSFIVRPQTTREKLSVAEAAKLVGCSIGTIYRLYHAGRLEGERASPSTLRILSESLQAHLAKTREDPEYWENNEIKSGYQSVIR